MSKELISRSAFSRLCEVSPGTVTRACLTHLKPAVSGKRIDLNHPNAQLFKNKHLGTDNTEYNMVLKACIKGGRWSESYIRRTCRIGKPKTQRHIARMVSEGVYGGGTPLPITTLPPKSYTRGRESAKDARKSQTVDTETEIPENIQAFADMTLREIITRFGTDTAFVDYLAALKSIDGITTLRLKNATSEGKLISRDLVETGLVARIEGLFTKLLTDGSKTLAYRVHAMVKSGSDAGEVETYISGAMTNFIKPTKVKMAKVLRDA